MSFIMSLRWQKCQGDVWCQLNTVNLGHQHFDNMEGVYIIWHGGANAHTVYVGQGIIRDRLAAHRLDEEIQAFSDRGLYVTWARVAKGERDGVEAYLANRLEPIVGRSHPQAPPIATALPW